MTEFRVVLDGIDLDDETHAAIAHDVEAAAMKHLATLDLGGDRVALHIPILYGPGTKGLVAVGVDVKDALSLPALNAGFERFGRNAQ